LQIRDRTDVSLVGAVKVNPSWEHIIKDSTFLQNVSDGTLNFARLAKIFAISATKQKAPVQAGEKNRAKRPRGCKVQLIECRGTFQNDIDTTRTSRNSRHRGIEYPQHQFRHRRSLKMSGDG